MDELDSSIEGDDDATMAGSSRRHAHHAARGRSGAAQRATTNERSSLYWERSRKDEPPVDVALLVSLGALAVSGAQAGFSRRQDRQQQYGTVRAVESEWRELAPHVERVRVLCAGPITWAPVVPSSLAWDLVQAVTRARDARLAMTSALRRCDDGDGSGYDLAQLAEQEAESLLAPFRTSVDLVSSFLARMFTDVARGQLSTVDAYRIAGQELAFISEQLRGRLLVPIDAVSGCPGPFHAESDLWRSLSLAEIGDRMLWSERLAARPAQHRKVLAMLDLLDAEAILVGDVEHAAPETQEPAGLATPMTVGRLRSLANPISRRHTRKLARRLVDATIADHRSVDADLPRHLARRRDRRALIRSDSAGDADDRYVPYIPPAEAEAEQVAFIQAR